MYKYHYTANNPCFPTAYSWVANTEGWVYANSLDHAEDIIADKGYKRVSLTRYNKDKDFQPQWRLEGAPWVNLPYVYAPKRVSA